MTHEDASNLTLGELEALVARLENAARTYREAMAVLGGHAPTAHAPAPVPLASDPQRQAAHLRGPLSPEPPIAGPYSLEPAFGGPYRAPQQPTSPILMTPEREEYLASIRADPQRAALLAQFRKDGPAQEESVRTEMLEAFGGGT